MAVSLEIDFVCSQIKQFSGQQLSQTMTRHRRYIYLLDGESWSNAWVNACISCSTVSSLPGYESGMTMDVDDEQVRSVRSFPFYWMIELSRTLHRRGKFVAVWRPHLVLIYGLSAVCHDFFYCINDLIPQALL